ncbi:hypothetical protein V1478_012240 [Vespula squamosa]|uniref:Uncharacterized protein n=1 Tax=Vespula squamosa TaxID=30214 RepID=A0ABD2ACM1_VESSQ
MSRLQIGIVHRLFLSTRDDNKVGLLDDFVDFWRSFLLTFEEFTSQLPRDAFHGSHNEVGTQVEYLNCALAVFDLARRQQSREFGRLCRFLAQFSFDFRRVHIVGPTEYVSWKL